MGGVPSPDWTGVVLISRVLPETKSEYSSILHLSSIGKSRYPKDCLVRAVSHLDVVLVEKKSAIFESR
jgi:hypothetical protein